jgi:macrodomain Ter protein organizer (MatP/YcbG family)
LTRNASTAEDSLVVRRKGFAQKETSWVRRYIERKFGAEPKWPDETQRQASRAAFEMISTGHTEARETFQWCNSWLSPAQWNSLRRSLGAWRHYQNKPDNQKKSISIDHEAWLYLTTLAKRDSFSISKFLIDRLGDEYRKEVAGE